MVGTHMRLFLLPLSRLINYFFFFFLKTGFCLLGTEGLNTEDHKKMGLKGQFMFTAWITTLGTSEINGVERRISLVPTHHTRHILDTQASTL